MAGRGGFLQNRKGSQNFSRLYHFLGGVYKIKGINYEPLLGVIRKQGECTFRHKGAGGKGQNSQGSMKIVIREQGAQFLSVKRQQRASH